jgi:hypothetical protein
VKPSEALKIIRTKSFFDPQQGEAAKAGGKTIERAVRDSFKDAVPDAVPPLRDQGRAIDARELLDRSNWRDANRDQINIGGLMGLANRSAIIGTLLQLAKEKQFSAGLAAARYGPKITRNAQATGEQLQQAIRALLAGTTQDE